MAANAKKVIAVISPRSVGGLSIFDTEEPFTPETVQEFRSEDSVIRSTVNELQRRGVEILNVGPITISFGGPPKLFHDVFGVKLRKEKMEMAEGVPKVEYFAATAEEAKRLLEPPQALKPMAEGVAIAQPPELFESALPPVAPIDPNAYRYFFVPDDIAVMLRSSRVHRLNGTGSDVVVAMIDTGHYAHPFFNWHGYRVLSTLLGPDQSNPGDDMVGHGTGESANIFAAAPDIRLRPIKGLLDPVGDFNVAVASTPKPHIITNSWGYNVDHQSWVELREQNEPLYNYLRLLEATIVFAVADGIVVCFSCGNGTKRGFPGSHLDVISVGGVHVNYPDLSLEASSYASSFASQLYPGRHCPDVCGLTGKAATPGMSPAEVKDKLMATARDVTTGTSGTGETAGPGMDDATGAGLVDAKWAYITTFSDVAAEFIMASSEKQKQMLETGQMPREAEEFMADFIDTLRSR